jgi:hypothetical protein
MASRWVFASLVLLASACGGAKVVSISSDGSTPDGVTEIAAGGRTPEFSVPERTIAADVVRPKRQETDLGDGWTGGLIDSATLSAAEFQKQFVAAAPVLPAGKQYFVAVIELRYSGSTPVVSTDAVLARPVDGSLKFLGPPCEFAVPDIFNVANVPAGTSTIRYTCAIVDSPLPTDAIFAMRSNGAAGTIARFSLAEPAAGTQATPAPGSVPFKIDSYSVVVKAVAVIGVRPPIGEALPIKATIEIAAPEAGAVGQLDFGMIGPRYGALAPSDCTGKPGATAGSATASAAGSVELCFVDRTGDGEVVGWVHSVKTGAIVYFSLSAA